MDKQNKSITEIHVTGSHAEGNKLRKIVGRLASNVLYDAEAVGDIQLAIGEAFANAVKYGKAESKVSLHVEAEPGSEIALEMDYPSAKFDTAVTYPQDIMSATGGFGRFIIEKITDDIEYNFDNGQAKLRMRKRS